MLLRSPNWVLLLVVWLCLGPCVASADSLINLQIGAQRIISLDAPVSRIVVTNPGVIETTVLNDRELQVIGVRGGHTGLTVFTSASNQGDAFSVQVGSPAEAAAPGPASSGPAAPNAAQSLRDQADLKDVHVNGGVMSGSVPSLDAHERAAAIAKASGASTDLTHVAGGQMVAVEIHFAAVSVTTMKELGFNFQSLGKGFQGALTGPSTVSSFGTGATGLTLGTSLPLASAFNLFLSSPQSNALGIVSALSSAGLMQELAEPTLVARSGEHASFLAGGDIPIPVPQNGAAGSTSVTIDYHPYGVKLDIAPVVLSSHRILLSVAPEVSEIDTANGVTFQGFTVPAFRRRSTSTTIELEDGQSYLLSGLIYNNDSYIENRIPGLGDLPIIGNFFKYTQNSRQRQELIVIATPHIVGPLDNKVLQQLPGSATAHYDPTFGDILLNSKPLDRVVRDYGLVH